MTTDGGGVHGWGLANKQVLARVARTRLGLAGLTLLLVGAIGACAAGVVLAILLGGEPSDRSTLKWLLLFLGVGGVTLAALGNLLWYRARIADRSDV